MPRRLICDSTFGSWQSVSKQRLSEISDEKHTDLFYECGRHCGDNAACEGFFGMLKRERVNRKKYQTMDIVKTDIFNYIERFYNPRMRRKVVKSDWKFSAVLRPAVYHG